MQSRQEIEQSFKDIALPAGEGAVAKIQLGLLIDIREYLGALVGMEQSKQELEAVRRARELAAAERYRKEVD